MTNIPGLHPNPDPETQEYVLNHTMLRVKDPKVSLDFYSRVLGMKLLRKVEFSEWKFTLYFLAYLPDTSVLPESDADRGAFVAGREGILELTHNWGTEDQDKTPYHNGNSDPRGFGHICISVPDIENACARFEKLNVTFQKKLGEGGMKNIAFIRDPDEYWIEVIQPGY
jgi:lactoylglutathione lyase